MNYNKYIREDSIESLKQIEHLAKQANSSRMYFANIQNRKEKKELIKIMKQSLPDKDLFLITIKPLSLSLPLANKIACAFEGKGNGLHFSVIESDSGWHLHFIGSGRKLASSIIQLITCRYKIKEKNSLHFHYNIDAHNGISYLLKRMYSEKTFIGYHI